MSIIRQCNKCKEMKNANEFYPRRLVCKACCIAKAKEYYLKHIGKRKKYARQYYTEHAEYFEQYRAAHKKPSRAWRAAHKEKAKAYSKAYYAAHGDSYGKQKRRQYQKQYWSKHRKRLNIYNALYRIKHKDWIKIYTAQWKKDHRESCKERGARRRARERNAPVVEKIDIAYIFRRDKGRCHLCGKKVDTQNWHLDHVIPLSKNGEHSHRNVAVSCPTCNLRKWSNIVPCQLKLIG